MRADEVPLSTVTPSAIADHAIIGDGRTAALCGIDGSIDWLCVPRFDSAPVFARLVDPHAGGSFSIRPERPRNVRSRYRERSAILETEWQTETGMVRLVDGMVLDVSSTLRPQLLLVRRVNAVDGPVPITVRFDPRRGF